MKARDRSIETPEKQCKQEVPPLERKLNAITQLRYASVHDKVKLRHSEVLLEEMQMIVR